MKHHILICFLILSSLFVNGKGIRYGKFSKEEIQMMECQFEKEATAVILAKTCQVDWKNSKVYYLHHVRIKILKEEGLKNASVEIPYFRKDDLEKIIGVKGQTVNFSKDGKKEIISLDSKSVFSVDIDERYGAIRFSMPKVKVGSVIEYVYTSVSRIHSCLETWYFQSEIPTCYSSVKVNMSKTYEYDMIMLGERLKAKYRINDSDEWNLTNLPSIKKEPYLNNCYDYIDQIRFKLIGYYKVDSWGGLVYERYSTTWEMLAKEYEENVDFFGRKPFARKVVEGMLNGNESDREKIRKIYDFVSQNVRWDETYNIYPHKSAPNILEDKVGNSAEINYLLILLFQEAGLKAHPALTKPNFRGMLQVDYPLMNQFDQVLACVLLDGKEVFLNAAPKFHPYNLLATEDLNYMAFVIDGNDSYWSKILTPEISKQHIKLTCDLSDLQNPSSQFSIEEHGYFAVNSRIKLDSINNKDWINNYLIGSEYELEKDSIFIENKENVNEPIKGMANVKIVSNWDEDTELIYFHPFPEQIVKNPFLAESRLYRIDFNYKRLSTITVKVKLPKGYHFEEIPQSNSISLPNNKGKFILMSGIKDEELQMRTSFSIKTPTLDKTYYPYLKEFYSQLLAMLNSQIVIKKNQNFSEK